SSLKQGTTMDSRNLSRRTSSPARASWVVINPISSIVCIVANPGSCTSRHPTGCQPRELARELSGLPLAAHAVKVAEIWGSGSWFFLLHHHRSVHPAIRKRFALDRMDERIQPLRNGRTGVIGKQ